MLSMFGNCSPERTSLIWRVFLNRPSGSQKLKLEKLCGIKQKASGIWRGNVMYRWLNLLCTTLGVESSTVVTDTLRFCYKFAREEEGPKLLRSGPVS